MAQMSEMQKHFINENKELFQQSLEELEASTSAAAEHRYTHFHPSMLVLTSSARCPGTRSDHTRPSVVNVLHSHEHVHVGKTNMTANKLQFYRANK